MIEDESIKRLLKDYKTIYPNSELSEEDLLNHCIKHIGYIIKKRIVEKVQSSKEIGLDDLWQVIENLS